MTEGKVWSWNTIPVLEGASNLVKMFLGYDGIAFMCV